VSCTAAEAETAVRIKQRFECSGACAGRETCGNCLIGRGFTRLKPRWYFRRRGCKRIPLPGVPGSAEFMQAYEAALSGALKR
jgi:hypothetical protein